MSLCAVCDLDVPWEFRGYTTDDEAVHVGCVDSCESPCFDCNLIHVGICA